MNQLEERDAKISDLESKIYDLTRYGNPTYDADHMRLWNKNVSFMRDPLFRKAYNIGINSDHGLGIPGAIDIHIEYRIAVCCWAAWHCRQLAGDFVECGTNTGIMSLAICDYIDFNATKKNFYLFDTYEGIPLEQITEAESHALQQNAAYRDCFDIAKKNFSPYPRANLVKGKVPDTLSVPDIDKVCYLMIDMNIAAPERAALEFFWDKIVPGGIVLFDDYGWAGYEAQKEAHDKFAMTKGLQIFNLPTSQGMLIKPPK
ncbi:macrocin-O-methyltransferase TylF [Bosea sp. 124]|nr:macrocin-O-methyltransferase TylF [Bosea sp. 124]